MSARKARNILTTLVFTFCLQAVCLGVPADYVTLSQGWNPSDRELAHYGNLGAEIMPEIWFGALETSNSSRKFIATLSDFGFISTTGGFPVGLT
ncbi:MAG: hypothetical protein EOP04_26895, partial [Proteobacteria bacterium]